MVLKCCAVFCSTTQKSTSFKKGARFHKIPKDPARRRQWAIAIRRKAGDGDLWIPWEGAALCSLHFPEEDIDRTGQTVRLREGVTPSLFNYSETGVQNTQKRGGKQLLSQEELNEILDEGHQCGITENSPPITQPQLPLPSSGPSLRPLTRASIRVRRLSTKHSQLLKSPGKGQSGKARAPDHSFLRAKTSVQPDHPYQQLSSDSDDPAETGRVPSPEPRPPSPSPPPLTVPEPLNLPAGRLTRYLAGIKDKQQRLHHLQKTYLSLLDKVQFRNSHSDWWSEKTAKSVPETKTAETPLLTLRNERVDRDPPLVPIAAVSEDTLLPLTPNEAWKSVTSLREQVLDLQLALMNSRIQVLDGELRLQEAKAIHKRYKVDVKEERKQTHQSQKETVREAEKRSNEPCSRCPGLRRKLAVVGRVADKKVRRAEALSKRLENIFTPMQMRTFRTGKKPRWVEEDIRRAIKLKMYVSHRGYNYIRQSMGIPLPTAFILSHGVERYKSLLPLYEEMLAENKKKVPKSKTGKDGRSVLVKKRKLDEVPRFMSLDPQAIEQPLVKRQKKRPLAQPPPQQPHGYEVEFVSRDAQADGVEAYASAASSYRSRAAGEGGGMGTVQPSWAPRTRAWEMDDEESDEEMLEEMTRPRETHDARGRLSGTSELR